MPKFYVQYPLRDGQEGAKNPRRTGTQTAQCEQDRRSSMEAIQGGGGETRQTPLVVSRRGAFGEARARRVLASALLAALPCFAAEPSTKARTISYVETEEIPRIYVAKGFETEVKIDKAETIVAATSGLADFAPSFVGHVAILKFMGTNTGQKTDLRLLCASGNEYSFVVEEISKRSDIHADLTVFVKNGDDEAKRAMLAPPKLFTAEQVTEKVTELENRTRAAEEALQKSEQQRNSAVAQAAQKEFASLSCNYQFYDRKGEDFHPSACSDGKFTRVEVHTQEVPSFFELKDGKLSLVQATYSDGHYIIPKVIDSAQLKVGKSSVKFKRVS